MRFDYATSMAQLLRSGHKNPLIAMLLALTIWFGVGVLPWINEAPDLDAMVNLRESFIFYNEGLDGLLKSRGGSTHPPMVYLLNSIAFYLGGARPESVYVLGTVLLIALCINLYALFRHMTDATTSALAAVVVAMNPLVVCCFTLMMSEAIIVLIFSLCSLALSSKQFRLLSISLCGFALVKQTALVFIGAFAFSFFVFEQTAFRQRIFRTLALIFPALLCVFAWMSLLHYRGGGAWNNELMSGNTGGSPFLAFFSSILDGYTSVYFRQNFANAFLINFNWLSIVGIAGAVWLCIRNREYVSRPFLVPGICGFIYTALVFPFPTWTIPRYGLPALFPALLITIYVILNLAKKRQVLIALGCLFGIAQFNSIDPMTSLIYGHFLQRGQKLYATDYSWRGPDRAMYNFQMSLMTREQNRIIKKIYDSGADVVVGDCHELKIGEKLWTLSVHASHYRQFSHPKYIPCLLESELENSEKSSQLNGKRITLLPPIKKLSLNNVKPSSVTSIAQD